MPRITPEKINDILWSSLFNGAGLREALAEGADVNVRNQEGETPLHTAASYGNVAVCRMLLQANADVAALDNRGRTPKEIAQIYKWRALARLLGQFEQQAFARHGHSR